ncbi:HupE/UreJ family protein [Acidobacteria bacterium AH-259-O06]|nr:HupE/UreJ family protein [Acidobacteria bacterium AH-259-O06]
MAPFVKLGIEHILTGYDHLAFLLGLILLGGSIRRLIAIVSSFTVAHSVTLTLATLDVLVLPTRFVESAIALSICYIALENIFVREINGRWKITFFFGLIHGFGFSNILREMQLPTKGLLTSLFSFNAGVEIGQVVIITLLCPLIFFVARQTWHKSVVRRGLSSDRRVGNDVVPGTNELGGQTLKYRIRGKPLETDELFPCLRLISGV